MDDIKNMYQLDHCLDWIIENKFTKVVVQLKLEGLKHSVEISDYLKLKHNERSMTNKDSRPLDIYISQSNTCCVDLIVTQHVSHLDAIIHIGQVCLSQPHIQNQTSQIPILFVFERLSIANPEFADKLDAILNEIKSLRACGTSNKICVMYDTNFVDYANKLVKLVAEKDFSHSCDIARLYSPNPMWHTTPYYDSIFVNNQDKVSNVFGHFLLGESIENYNCALYLGDNPSIAIVLQGPPNLSKINCQDMRVEKVNVSKLLNRRVALIERLKDEEELRVGVIITNPLPDIGQVMERLEIYSESRKHTLYFISMIQTIDECKIGNFDLCDAFVVVNSCTCSTVLESLVFNRPIITELEYKLACGFEAEYGRIMWSGSTSHPSMDDIVNKRKVSDVSLALVQTRNELLERCSQARVNMWSGLQFKASGSGCGGIEESLTVEEGLKGIASSYSSEPLKKVNSLEKDNVSDSTGNAFVADLRE